MASQIARSAGGTWDPFLQIAALGMAATYGVGAGLVDGGVRALSRADAAQDGLAACEAELARLSAPPDPAQPEKAQHRDGAAELRALGVEPPR